VRLRPDLSGLEFEHGDRIAALDHLAVAIRNHRESGTDGMITNPLAILAALLDLQGRYEPAATIAGYARVHPLAAANPSAQRSHTYATSLAR
jgi:hypothetical protein